MNKIIYLLKNDSREIAMLKESLYLLNINFLPHNNYPVYIIHDELIDHQIIQDLKNYSKVDFKLIQINFNIEEYTKNIKDNIQEYIYVDGVDKKFDIGYRHMCRFYSYGIYELKELQDTNYYLRLDCDSYFIDEIPYNIFEHMEDNELIYGYNQITTDNPVVSKNLWEVSKEYSKYNNTLKIPIDEIKQYNVYYTNFEIAKFNWFSKSDYKNFFNFIDKQNGIYEYRWGDHCIKYLGIEMFLEDSKKQHFNLPYRHGNIFNLQ